MEKPTPVKITMNDNAKFFADALARHFTEEVINLHKDDYKKNTKQKPA